MVLKFTAALLLRVMAYFHGNEIVAPINERYFYAELDMETVTTGSS